MNIIPTDTAWKSAAETAVLEKDEGSAVSHLCTSSSEATAEGDGNQNLSQTRNSPESLGLENAALGTTAEAKVPGTVTDAAEAATPQWDELESAFVCAVVFKVLRGCGAIGPHTKQGWEVPFERLVSHTKNGLIFSTKFCPNKKLIEKVCDTVVKEVQQRFSPAQIASVLLTQDPAVGAAIVKSIQIHITKLASRNQSKWALGVLQIVLKLIILITTILVCLAIFGII